MPVEEEPEQIPVEEEPEQIPVEEEPEQYPVEEEPEQYPVEEEPEQYPVEEEPEQYPVEEEFEIAAPEPETLNSEEIMYTLDQSIVNNSGSYTSYFDIDDGGPRTIWAGGLERTGCFSIGTGAGWNTANGGAQFIVFDVQSLNSNPYLKFAISGEDGSDGEMSVEIYINRDMDGSPDYLYYFDSCSSEQIAEIYIEGAQYVSILVNNMSDTDNNMVFYNFELTY